MNTWETMLDTTLRVYWAVRDKLQRVRDPPLARLELHFQHAPMMAEVVEQSKILCEDYIYSRLKVVLLMSESDGFKVRVPNGNASCSSYSSRPGKVSAWKQRKTTDVSTDIQDIGLKLECSYPHLYENVAAQIGMPLRSRVAVRRAMIHVGDFMFRHSVVTWGRIVGLFAVAAAMARDCVLAGRGEHVADIVAVFSELIERHAAAWICKQGGWVAIVKAVRSVREARYMWILTVLGAVSGFAVSWAIPVQIC